MAAEHRAQQAAAERRAEAERQAEARRRQEARQRQETALGALAGESFEIGLFFESDWHMGAGFGVPGGVDALVRKDKDGLPFVPYSTLRGVWRDGCEQVAQGLDGGAEGPWSDVVNVLFGDQPSHPRARLTRAPRPALVVLDDARYPEATRQALRGRPELLRAVTSVRASVRIDPATGRAMDRHLRFFEVARGGARLSTRLTLPGNLNDAQRSAALSLLQAGALMVERVGKMRRRGLGRCRLEWPAALVDFLDLEADPPDFSGVVVGQQGVDLCGLGAEPAGDGWRTYRLRLQLKTPMLVPRATLGNVVEGMSYLPGTFLFSWLMSRPGLDRARLWRAIKHHHLVVTDATPVVGGARGLPVPPAIFHRKMSGGLHKGQGVFNRLVDGPPPAGEDSQLKGHRGGYVGAFDGVHLPQLGEVRHVLQTSNIIEDEKQRPTSDVGGVFSYELLEQDTLLEAELRLHAALDGALGEGWHQGLSGEHRMGSARNRGLGRVEIAVTPAEAAKEPARGELERGRLTVWLLSDLLLRDERLRPDPSPARLEARLSSELEVRLKLRASGQGLLGSASRVSRQERWHAGWGLPQGSRCALAAGSCFVFEFEASSGEALTLLKEKLQRIEQGGLGERRAEGFGQIRFCDGLLTGSLANLNHEHEHEHEHGHEHEVAARPAGEQEAQGDERAHLEVIEREALLGWVRERSLQLAASNPLGFSASKPKNSQLGALLSVLQEMKQDTLAGLSWAAHVEKNRAKDWPPETLNALRALFSEGDKVWHLLWGEGTVDGERRFSAVSGAALKSRYRVEAVKIVVTDCIRHARRGREAAAGPGPEAQQGGG